MAHGLLPGQVVTLLARTNTGKTIFSLNILHRMRMMKPDIKILFLSLEQMRNEWFERAHRIMNFYQPGATTQDTNNSWIDNLFLVDENRLTEDTLEMLIEQYKFETGHKPDIVLVDYLGYYARSFQGEEYARITSAIMGLKGIAKRHKLVFLAPHQANRSNDMGAEVRMDQGRGAGTVEETSDVSLTMWNPDQRKPEHDALLTKADQKKELILKMPKARDSGVNTMCVLQSAPLTLAIVPKGDPLYDRALKERQYWINGMDWKDAVLMHMKDDGQVQLDSNNKWRPVMETVS
jgi:replicative DNA helicase